MMEEIKSFHVNDTWELSELPKRKKTIRCKWVFAKNDGSLDATMCYKAILVAKAYAHIGGYLLQ